MTKVARFFVVELGPDTPVRFTTARSYRRVGRAGRWRGNSLLCCTLRCGAAQGQRCFSDRGARQARHLLSVCLSVGPEAGHAFVSGPVALLRPARNRADGCGFIAAVADTTYSAAPITRAGSHVRSRHDSDVRTPHSRRRWNLFVLGRLPPIERCPDARR